MNAPIRVMLCDDSSIMRRLIISTVRNTPDILVVAEAVDGRDALQKLPSVRPDIVVMDIKMPVMDGIEAVKQIRKTDRKLPVIMFSSLTSDGADATLDAIAAGANDFATKPVEVGHIGNAVAHLRKELVPKIYEWTHHSPPQPPTPRGRGLAAAAPVANPTSVAPAASPIKYPPAEAIGIGVSTGGPQTLSTVISGLPSHLTVPIFIVQHMPAAFTGLLAERLAAEQNHRVYEGTHGGVVQDGDIVIAPGDFHMTVVRQQGTLMTQLNQNPPENSCRPAVDPLFRSLASCFGNRCLGVILTGMGKDGTSGAAALKERGARVMVQDKATSVVWGMPGSVVQNGLADLIVPCDQIALEITRAIGSPEPTLRA